MSSSAVKISMGGGGAARWHAACCELSSRVGIRFA